MAKKRGDRIEIAKEFRAVFPSLSLPANLSLESYAAPKKIISGKYTDSEFIEWIVNEDMILLNTEYDSMRASLLDFDTRVTINAMVLAGFPEEEISKNKGKWSQLHLDIYLDAFFNVGVLTTEEIQKFLSMVNDNNEAKILRASVSNGSQEYLSWVLGLKARRLGPEAILDEIARGFFLKQKDLMLDQKYEAAAKLANIAIKAAKEMRNGGGGDPIEDLLEALETLEFKDEEPVIYLLEDLKESN